MDRLIQDIRFGLRTFIRQPAIALAAVGIAIGLAGALLLTRSLTSLLYEVKPTDPLVLTATCLGLLAVAGIASYVPARRAMRVDPMVALRAD